MWHITHYETKTLLTGLEYFTTGKQVETTEYSNE